MIDEEHDPTRFQRPTGPARHDVISDNWAHIDADGAPIATQLSETRPFAMSPDLEVLCAWLDAG